MSTKKFGIVAGIVLTLSVVVSPAFAACSLTTLSECDSTGLMALIVQLLGSSQTGTQTGTGTITGIPAGFTFTTNLAQGSTGSNVKYLQILLNSDTATSVGNKGSETTYFGAMTKAAVVKFQNKYASEVLTPYGLAAGTGFFGTASRAKANAMIASGSTTTTTTTPATGAYTVSLAASQPSGTLGEASAYNPVLKINVSAGATAQTVTSLTVQKTGLSIDTNVAGVVVADENGVRHGNIVTFANGVATVTFANDPITVPAGTTKVIQVQFNMVSGVNGLAGTVGANLTAMSGTPTGLPLIGNTFSMVDTTATLGTLTADVKSLTTATVSKDIGTTGYEIQRFSFVAGANEDMYLKSLKIYQNGTVADADITNIKLVAPDGTVLSTVASATNKYVTFDLTAAPYKIAKGLTKDLSVKVDVVNGSSRTAQFIIQNDYDVVATGASTGLNVIPTAGASVDSSFPIGDIATGNAGFNHMTIASGSLYVSKATTSPSGTISIGASTATIATFNFESRGEALEIQKLFININGSGLANDELAGTVRLVTEDGQTLWSASPTSTGLVANTAAGTAANIYTLSTYYTIPAGTTKKISLVVDTGSAMDATDTIYGRISDIYYKKLTSNAYATYSASAYITGNELSASAGTLTVVKNGSLGSSTKVEGQSEVKIGSYLLQTNSTEGVNVSSIGIAITGTDAADVDASFKNLKLKKADGTQIGSAVTSPVIDGATANAFTVSGELNIAANTTAQIDVYIDITTAAADGGSADTLVTKILQNGVSGTGATSSATAAGPSAAAGITGQTIAIVEGGTLTVAMETSGAASAQFLTTGLAGVELAKVKLAATVEDMKIDRLEIRSIKGDGNIAQVKLLGTGLASDPTAAVTAGTAVFTFASGSEIIVPAYGSKVLTVAADTTNIGTLTAGTLGTIGFGTLNAIGSGSGAIVQDTVTGTSYTASADDGSEAIAVGNIIYFTTTAASGTNTTPGYYMVTTQPGGGGQGLTDNGLGLNGGATITKWTAGQIVTMLTPTSVEIDADTDSNNALAVGDVVYFYGDVDGTDNSASTGWHVVTTAYTANSGAVIVLDGANVTIDADDGIAKFANASIANALVGNIMRFEEVEPTITLAADSKVSPGSTNSYEEVAKFDIKAAGSRDMTFDSLTVEKGGDNSPFRYVTKMSIWNGSNMLAEVANTSAAGTTDDGAGGATTISGVTVTVCSGANNTQANELAAISQDEFDKWAVGDTLTFYDGSAVTATATILSITGDTISACAGDDDPSIVFSTSPAIGQDKTVTIWNNRVHFNSTQGDTGDTALSVAPSITAGQTMTITVKADTTAVKTGVTSGNVRFSASIPGAKGPLTSTVGGLDWNYTPLASGGLASYKTQADSYPVNGNTLTY
ncbi:MAG TPA: hypothetical protein PLD14_00130 [Candidatus Pacearchaeota archaeon]|nr:hypothetical protein [Candidatus Pacearchaeota archaeon]HPR79621.1 hypothetical protein [Candidatus Pacearchaeota archaeon]